MSIASHMLTCMSSMASLQVDEIIARGVAQPGRALGSGPRSRWFKSSRPDHLNGLGSCYMQGPFFYAFVMSRVHRLGRICPRPA